MRVLIVSQYFWPENFRINDLADALVERGHEVTVYTGMPNYPVGKFFAGYSFLGPFREARGKFEIIRVPLIPRGQKKGLKLALNYLSYFVTATLLAPILIRKSYDVVFVYQLSPVTVAIPAIFLKYLKKIPIVMWVTDLWPESLAATGTISNTKIIKAVSVLVKWIYKNTDKILVSSKGFIKSVNKMGAPVTKVEYWPQWAEPLFVNLQEDVVDDSVLDKRVFAKKFKVMFAGNLGSAQGFETIIDSCKELKRINANNIKILVLGNGLMKEWIEEQIGIFELEEYIELLGSYPLEMMPSYFRHADSMLISLRPSEIFSITIPSKLQAYLASGKPIISSMDGEAPKLIQDNQAGMCSPAGDSKGLAEVILQMSQLSKGELDVLGKNARKLYERDFEREMLISRLEASFKSVATKS